MALTARIADKAGFLGALISAMGCASCFPALASFGAAVGLGFLTRWEGLFITTLIPLFALLALVANAASWRAAMVRRTASYSASSDLSWCSPPPC